MFSESGSGSQSINVMGNYYYVSPEETQQWGWRTEMELVNVDEIRMTAFNVTPGGEETKATEIIYTRVMSDE